MVSNLFPASLRHCQQDDKFVREKRQPKESSDLLIDIKLF